MPNIMAGSLNGLFPTLTTKKLEIISVVINNSCNLACKHCYLQTRQSRHYLSRREWARFFESAFSDLDLSVLSFAGKEVFVDKNSVGILLDAISLRDEIQEGHLKKTTIGVITNGTLLHKHTDVLLKSPPDYFDVSIDGLPKEHNLIRGEGAFEMLSPNLRWLSKQFPGKIWLTPTLLETNIGSLIEFIGFYSRSFDITNFSVGFYKEMNYTDQALKINENNYRRFIEQTIPDLESICTAKPLTVVIELDLNQGKLIDMLTCAGWIDSVEPISSVSREFSNGLTLRFNVARIPVGFWRSVRVSPEGYWVAAEDLMRVHEYSQLAAARLEDFDFSARHLYEAGIVSERFIELMSSAKFALPQQLAERL